MLKSIKAAASGEIPTFAFYLVNLLFWIPLVLTSIYCYARLDSARSYKSDYIKPTSLTKIESNVDNT